MSANQKFNTEYAGGIPKALGDRYYAQDRVRDWWFLTEQLGLVLKDIMGQVPVILYGGQVSQGGGFTLNIEECLAYAKKQVDVPLDGSVIPATVTTTNVEAIRIFSTTQVGFALSGTVNDSTTIHYVKLRYKEVSGPTRNRARRAGTWSYYNTPSFEIIVNTTAPTDEDVVLDQFTTDGFVISLTGDRTDAFRPDQASLKQHVVRKIVPYSDIYPAGAL